jgi:predicted ferric reductase
MMGVVYLLIVGHFMAAPAVFLDRESPSSLFLIAVAIIGVLTFLYSVFGMKRRTALPFTIEAVNPLERVTEVVLKPIGRMLDFKPGQFLRAQADRQRTTNGAAARPYRSDLARAVANHAGWASAVF